MEKIVELAQKGGKECIVIGLRLIAVIMIVERGLASVAAK